MKPLLLALLLACSPFAAFAQEAERPPAASAEKKDAEKAPKADVKDNVSTTSHTMTIGGEAIKYTARAGTALPGPASSSSPIRETAPIPASAP